jgi:hypothetical protein
LRHPRITGQRIAMIPFGSSELQLTNSSYEWSCCSCLWFLAPRYRSP